MPCAVETRKERLIALLDTQFENALAKGARRVARVPVALRHVKLVDLLAPSQPPIQPQVTTTKPATAKKASASTIRKPRTATTVPVAPRLRTAKRSAKRSSDDMATDDKENAQDSTKKRVRGITKPAPTLRTTRATSRQQTVLSPKNGNATTITTSKKPATRPR
jgi:hypothetical protein